MRGGRRTAGRAGGRDLRRVAPRRHPRADQHPPPFLPDADAGPPAGDQQAAVPLAEGALHRLGQDHPRRVPPRHAAGLYRAPALGLHHRGRPPLPLSQGPGGCRRRAGRRGEGPRDPCLRHPRLDEPLGGGWRPAAQVPDAGRRHHPLRQRAGAEPVPRREARRDGADRAGAVLAVQRHQAADARERGAGRPLRLPAPHPSRRDARRGRLLPRDVRAAPGRLSRGGRLDEPAGVARARHPLQRRRGARGSGRPASESATARPRT